MDRRACPACQRGGVNHRGPLTPHRVPYDRLQEFDPKHPEYFLTDILLIVQAQARIFAHLQDIAPEITDPILLETRIPTFLQGVQRFETRFRQAASRLMREP